MLHSKNTTIRQQPSGEIYYADSGEPLQYFRDGRLMWTEDPHTMPRKTRYKIDIKNVARQSTTICADVQLVLHFQAILRILNSTIECHKKS